MFVVHKTLLSKKKSEKIMQCPTIKSLSFSFGIDFSLNTSNIFLLLLKK